MKPLLLAVLITLLSPPAASAADALMGKTLFQIHCAMCHGAGATGEGRLADILQVPPPDLTELDQSFGYFPTDYVVRRIDGTERLKSHGDPMPVYLMLLDGPMVVIDAPDGAEVTASEAIADLVAWLESLQR